MRTGIVEKKRRKRWMMGAGGVIAVAIVTAAVASLEPAAPSVDRDTVWIGEVERGTLVRQVRGHGTLVPEELRWVPAPATGRVVAVHVDPGQEVTADQVLLKLANPEVERSAVDADNAVLRSEAELESLRMTLLSAELDQQASSAQVQADHVRATLQAEADRELFDKGLISDIQLRSSAAVAEAISVRREIEERRLKMTSNANQAFLDAKRAELEQQRALQRLRAEQLEALSIRAGIDGVVQQVTVQVGQQVAAGVVLAQVAEPTHLEAELRVPATRARDVRLGLPVSIDTRNGLVAGTVRRLDPTVREGTVRVEVRIDGELPEGARPDMAVEGTVEIERLENVIFMGRPVQAQEGATVGLYRIEDDDNHAVRVQVQLGRASVDTVEVVQGLAEGDRVILSDTSRWDDSDRIRLR